MLIIFKYMFLILGNIWNQKLHFFLFTADVDNIIYVDEDYEEGDYNSEEVS